MLVKCEYLLQRVADGDWSVIGQYVHFQCLIVHPLLLYTGNLNTSTLPTLLRIVRVHQSNNAVQAFFFFDNQIYLLVVQKIPND